MKSLINFGKTIVPIVICTTAAMTSNAHAKIGEGDPRSASNCEKFQEAAKINEMGPERAQALRGLYLGVRCVIDKAGEGREPRGMRESSKQGNDFGGSRGIRSNIG